MLPQTPVAEQVSVSARGHQMTASQQRAQRRVNPSGVSLVGVGVSPCADGVVVGDTVIRDDFVGGRADDLDAEAAYYRHRAIQEERALGPGYYVDLLRGMAADRAAMAQRIRTAQSTDRRTHRHVGHDRGR